MESSQGALPVPSQDAPPAGFITIEQVRNLPNEKIMHGGKKTVPLVNVIGFLKDFQPPRQTFGPDWKCSLEIRDSSVLGSHGMKVHIFWPESKMPKLLGAGDVILARKIKPQMNSGAVDLIATKWSEFHILSASRDSNEPSVIGKSWQSCPPVKCQRPTVEETAYVVKASAQADVLELPTALEFEQKVTQAMGVNKNKFSSLKDVEADRFYDLLGQVIQMHVDGDPLTLYLSDYTANSKFYEHRLAEKESDGRDGDEHNYTKSREKDNENGWPGPYGKMAIQMTLWDSHANFVREAVKAGDWILLRNVQVKYGKHGGLLEGVLRGDRNAFEGKVQVQIMEKSEEPDDNDHRWKTAVARKFEYEKRVKEQKLKWKDEAAGLKRKREGEPAKLNSKQRRKEKRAALEAKADDKLNLNHNIISTNPKEAAVPIKEILKLPKTLSQAKDERGAQSPFHICQYKAHVRVVDYFPTDIEDFAVGRRVSEYDMLSDYSGGEDTDREEDMRSYRSGKGFPKRKWEWRFALQVVDANPKVSTEQMWLIVGNSDAQMLLGLDAADLRKESRLLHDLKERLCIIWGDLEEQKSALKTTDKPKEEAPPSKNQKSSATRRPGDQPPTDSDDEDPDTQEKAVPRSENAKILSERNPNAGTKLPRLEEDKHDGSTTLQVKNKAFACCIRQYGVKVNENDASLANTGDGKRWERRFGLFGTKIS